MVVMETSDRQSGAGAAQGAGQGWYEGAVNHPSSPMPSQHHQVRIEIYCDSLKASALKIN